MVAKKSTIILVSIAILVLITSTGCSNNKPKQIMTQSIENIDKVLKDEGFAWSVTNEHSNENGVLSYLVSNSDQAPMCVIESYKEDDKKSIMVSFLTRVTQSPDAKNSEFYGWDKLMKLALELSGDKNHYKDFESELVDYASNRDDKLYGKGSFRIRVDNTHISVGLRPSNGSENGYDIAAINIYNTDYYEFIQFIVFDQWKELLAQEKVDIFENVSVSDFDSVKEVAESNYQYFTTQGSLKDFRKATASDLPSEVIINLVPSLYDGDYFVATLSDGNTGIKVLVRNTTLTNNELKQDRNHLVVYLPEEDIYLIKLSTSKQSVD